jgi:16S rRNA (cytosine967-C5)-methyltransferase
MNGRDYALSQLDRLALPGWKTGAMRSRATAPTDPRDLALAEQIRVGVIKNLRLLEFLIDHYSNHRAKIDPLVRKILAIAMYQLRFLTRIPPSAAVDEAVEQVRRFGRRAAAGFVNAVLRRATREPVAPLPDENTDRRHYATTVLSHPPELFNRLAALLGEEKALDFCRHDNAEPPTLLRAFRGGAFPPAELPQGVRVVPHEQSGMFVVNGARRDLFARWAGEGIAQVQDATAARVVEQMDLEPGQNVLDRCAGLGTKTLQIREHLSDDGWIMAMDPSEPRCEGLRRLVAARNIFNVAVVQGSMLTQIRELKQPWFDRILVDAPCSNSGVLARRPEARYAQNEAALRSLAMLQNQILDDCVPYLRPGGLLVYSTCSIWPEENQQRVERFLKEHPQFQQVRAQFTWPSFETHDPTRYHDGGFFAVLGAS